MTATFDSRPVQVEAPPAVPIRALVTRAGSPPPSHEEKKEDDDDQSGEGELRHVRSG